MMTLLSKWQTPHPFPRQEKNTTTFITLHGKKIRNKIQIRHSYAHKKVFHKPTLESQDLVVYYWRQATMTSQERKLRAPSLSLSL
jgi:hypothetical protein